ncbi:MAG: hypothetical protein TUN42_01445 [Dehalogenimonas sp.]
MESQEIAYWRRLTDEYEGYLKQMSLQNPMAVNYGAKTCLRCGQCCSGFALPVLMKLPLLLHI